MENMPPPFDGSACRVLVITLSERAYKGIYPDVSGERLKQFVQEFGGQNNIKIQLAYNLIPDDPQLLEGILAKANLHDLVLTTGGTGIGPKDFTPDVVKKMLTKEIPGIMDHIRLKYGSTFPNALLSRSVAGAIGETLIYTLPGSEKAVEEYWNEIKNTLLHCLLLVKGISPH
ncbi:MAG: MogA/MoaB family molybdenum cofactor biosynthesis protein [Bacteroidales bacterium]|nr:MogA/MoaB family molybdenum cofactor biosynthesis protein [Bacteroidales bacterium]